MTTDKNMENPRRLTSILRAWSGPRFLLLILFAGLALMAFPVKAVLQFDVFLGYDGIVPEASWFPIVLEIKNDGPTFTGVIEVTSGAFNESQTRRLVVELPTGTLKRISVPVFASARYQSSWDVRLLDEHGRLHAEQASLRPKRVTPTTTPLIGAIPRTANGVPVPRQILSGNPDSQPAVARFQTSIFPDNPLVLEGMDTLYLNSEKAPELNVGQIYALNAWLNAGGHLIVGVEQFGDVNATPWLRQLVPCDLNGMRQVAAHTEIQQWLQKSGATPGDIAPNRVRVPDRVRGAAGNPFANLPDDPDFEKSELQVASGAVRNGEVLVAAGDVPLIVTAHQGRGRVTALLFSPEREPFRSWKNIPSFWSRVTGVPPELYSNANNFSQGGWSVDGVFGAMIDSKQIRKLPVEWLLLLLIIYLVVIGPFDQYWLKRIKRPMLTWITFPCYVVMFSLLIYFIGYRLRAGETEWNEVHFVDVLANGQGAELRGHTYASIYSPINATYKVESQQRFSAFRGEFQSSWSGGAQSTERADVLQSGDNYKAEIFVPVWTSQLYASDWWQSEDTLPLAFSVATEGQGWSVTIRNGLDRAITNAQVVVGGRLIDLGEVPAGQMKTFKVTSAQGTAVGDYVSKFASGFQNASQQRLQAFGSSGGGRILDLPNTSAAISFLSHYSVPQAGRSEFLSPPGLDLSPLLEQGDAVLLAWEPDYSPMKPINQFPTRRSHKDTLWRVVAAINAPPIQ